MSQDVKTSRQRRFLLVTTTAMAMAGGAYAQETPISANRSVVLEEVIVEARKTLENAQEVPLTVQSFDADAIEELQIEETWDLQYHTPGLLLTAPSGTTGGRTTPNFSVRGQSESSVALYYAGVIVPSDSQGRTTGGITRSLFDISSIQVVKGPQGTLTGRNSTGGAIFIEPNRPTSEVEGYFKARYDSLETKDVQGAVNIPLIDDVLMLRAAGQIVRSPGFTENLTPGFSDVDDTDYMAGRVSLLYRPSDRFENFATINVYRSRDHGAGWLLLDADTTTPCTASSRTFNCLYPTIAAEDIAAREHMSARETFTAVETFVHEDSYNFSNITTFDLTDSVTLKNVFGHQRVEQFQQNSNYGNRAPIVFYNNTWKTQTISDEIQVLGNFFEDRLQTVSGVYIDKFEYLPNDSHVDFFGQPVPPYFGNHTYFYWDTPYERVTDQLVPELESKSTAVFAHAKYDLSPFVPGLTVSGGYRYTWATVRQVSTVTNNGACALSASQVGVNLANCTAELSADFNAPTWTLSANYNFTDDMMVYLTYSRGYKQGGFNASTPDPAFAAFDSETLDSYELGVKADFSVGGMLARTNVGAFYGDYKDIQRSTTAVVTNPTTGASLVSALTTNAASAKIYGLDADITLIPTQDLEFRVGYSYLNTSYTEFQAVDPTGGPVDLSGRPFSNAPEHTINLSATYYLPVDPQLGEVSATLTGNYRSSVVFRDDGTPKSRDGARGVADFRLGWDRINQSQFSGAFYVRNLTDLAYPLRVNEYTAFGFTVGMFAPPRTIGVEISYEF